MIKNRIMGFLSLAVVILVAIQFVPDINTTVTSLVGTTGALYGTTAGTILGFVTLGFVVTILVLAFSGAGGEGA